MNEEQIQKMLTDTYEESKANTLHSMLKDFYNRKMRSIVVLIWSMAVLFIIGAIVCAVMFAKADQVKSLILYATLFIVFAHWVDLLKIFAWQMIHRNSIKREIKRLEIRIAELSETVKGK